MIDYAIDIPSHIECLPSTLYVEDIEYGVRKTMWGFEIPAEQMDYEGNFVRPRWARVLWKATDIMDIEVGDFILIKHGHWSTSIEMLVDGQPKKVWYLTPKSYKEGVMAVRKDIPEHLREYGIN
jgi:hypothetical protein